MFGMIFRDSKYGTCGGGWMEIGEKHEEIKEIGNDRLKYMKEYFERLSLEMDGGE